DHLIPDCAGTMTSFGSVTCEITNLGTHTVHLVPTPRPFGESHHFHDGSPSTVRYRRLRPITVRQQKLELPPKSAPPGSPTRVRCRAHPPTKGQQCHDID